MTLNKHSEHGSQSSTIFSLAMASNTPELAPSLFFRHLATDVILLIYVDDILITSSNTSQMSYFITKLSS